MQIHSKIALPRLTLLPLLSKIKKSRKFIFHMFNHQRFTVVSLVKCILYYCSPRLWGCGNSGTMLVFLNLWLKKNTQWFPFALLYSLWLNIWSPAKNMQIIFFYTFLALWLKCHLYHQTFFFFFALQSFYLNHCSNFPLPLLPILKAKNDSDIPQRKSTTSNFISPLNTRVNWFKDELWSLADLGLNLYIHTHHLCDFI